jgi:hypothetical protein
LDVQLADLLQDPATYDGRLVRVRGNVGQHEQSPRTLRPYRLLALLADGRRLRVMTVGLDTFKVRRGQLTVTGIFHDDATAWLEAVPESGGRIKAVQGDDSAGR